MNYDRFYDNETLQFVFVLRLIVHYVMRYYNFVLYILTYCLFCVLFGQYIIVICQTLYVVYKNYALLQQWGYDGFNPRSKTRTND